MALRRVIEKKTNVDSSSALDKPSNLLRDKGGPERSRKGTPGPWPQVNQGQKVEKKSIPHLMPRLFLPPPSSKVSRQQVHADPSKCPHLPQTVRHRDGWVVLGPARVGSQPSLQPPPPPPPAPEGAATCWVRGGAETGSALARSKPLAGKGCGSLGETWPLTWVQLGPLRWAPSPPRWLGPAALWCSWARRHRSARSHRLLPLLEETHSPSPRPGG